jgi:hypothetical protein
MTNCPAGQRHAAGGRRRRRDFHRAAEAAAAGLQVELAPGAGGQERLELLLGADVADHLTRRPAARGGRGRAAEAIETGTPVIPARSRVASWLHARAGLTTPRRFAGLARAAAVLPAWTATVPRWAAAGPATPTDPATTADRASQDSGRFSPAIRVLATVKIWSAIVVPLPAFGSGGHSTASGSPAGRSGGCPQTGRFWSVRGRMLRRMNRRPAVAPREDLLRGHGAGLAGYGPVSAQPETALSHSFCSM